MKRLHVNALLFDWGGVFQKTVDYAPRLELARLVGIDEPELEKAVFDHPAMRQASLGSLPARAAWETVVRDLGYNGELYDFVSRFFSGDQVDRQLVQLVQQLRQNGLKVGLLSNAPPSLTTGSGAIARWGMDGLFDCEVFSYRVKALKPSPLAFTAALDGLRAQARETVFIDDVYENIKGAEAVGLHALLYHGTEQLVLDLRGLGIAVPDIAKLR